MLALYRCADSHRAALPKTKNAKFLSRRIRVKAEECGRKAGRLMQTKKVCGARNEGQRRRRIEIMMFHGGKSLSMVEKASG